MDNETESDIIKKIDVQSNELHLEVIQELLYIARTHRTKQNESLPCTEVLRILWDHLQTELRGIDEQLLCSVCFYTILEFSDMKEFYLKKVLILIDGERALKDKLKIHQDLMGESKTLPVVSLIYGMFQSKSVVHMSVREVPLLVDVLNSLLDLLFQMAYEYSRYTFIVFKIMSSFKIVLGTELQEILFQNYNSSNALRLMNLATHNWENPITGVRDLNKTIFQIVVSMSSNAALKDMMLDIENLYWNKAKYFMVAEIIDGQNDFVLKHHWVVLSNHWIDGLVYSLSKPGLVSAGADTYYAILKKLTTENEWCNLFLDKIIQIINKNHMKTIENFCNYWCLTTFKKFPDLAKILLEKLENVEVSETRLYSSLCILKQANKLGLVYKKWDTTDYHTVEIRVLEGIEHYKTHIRMLAFEIVAVTLGKTMPTAIEFNLILNYLFNNVNSDCTVLRISMLGNIKYFLTHLCSSYTSHAKNSHDYPVDDLEKFYRRIQEFIIESLDLDGNYQRKITTIKLCNVLLSSLNEVPKKRQKQTTASGSAMIKFLKDKKCLLLLNNNCLMKFISLLNDPADDIREAVVQLLLDHFSKEITPDLMNYVIKNAKDSIRSKFFYQISCGQSMFRLITNIIIKETFHNTIFKNIDDVFNFAYNVLKTEFELKTDIVKSIEEGKQLHAYLNILQEVLKVSRQFSYQLKVMNDELPQLLSILEAVSNQFAWEDEPAVSSDFSKMSDMVQSIIASSGYNPLNEKDFAKISGLQQIVLNCLWLNVKASCDFASYLISFFKDDDIEACRRCLDIMTHVLETSRHKGAIEAAGAALGRAIQQLTSLPETSALSKLPRALLESKLTDLIVHANAASVTRRGAGLSIMVHRIVSSDMEKGKPLFHYFMATLLKTCNSNQAVPTQDDSQRDLPKAVYIHFLTRIVTDSSLASDMMYYSAELAEIAFDNLTSSHWQIRNAALQLYGALIPKLIGQKKASGTDDETVATVAIDEFITHSPKLWHHMKTCLQELNDTNIVESHSNVLPILNVLANLARRYSFTCDKAFESSSKGLLDSLMALLGSPIFTVRRLTAKCIFNIYDYEVICDTVSQKIKSYITENMLHGTLILVGHYHKHLQKNNTRFQNFLKELSVFINNRNHSYICRKEVDNLFNEKFCIKDVLSEAKCNKYMPGVFHWANNILQKYIQSCTWREIANILKIILQENDFEKYCEFILIRLQTDRSVSEEILYEISNIFCDFENKFQSSVIWEILYHISSIISCHNVDMHIFNYLPTEIPYRLRYVIPYIASAAANIPEEYLVRLTSTILSLCDPDKSDVDMRYIAALANNELAKVFPKLSDSVKITATICASLLLQDEDEDVRMKNILFYSNVIREKSMLQPYVCLAKILDKDFLQSHLDDPQSGIPKICDQLSEISVSYAKTDGVDEYNPFSNDTKNIYFEAEVVKSLLRNLRC